MAEQGVNERERESDMEARLEVYNSAREGHLHSLRLYLDTRSEEEVKRLVHDTTNGATPLIMACRNGHTEVVEYLVGSCKADIEQVGSVTFDGEVIDGAPPLWCAAAAGHLDIVRSLVRSGAAVNKTTYTNSTPLRAACFDGHYAVVQFLLENGADMEIANRHGHTCLMISCYKGHLKIVRYLLDKGASVNKKSLKGNTALHDCAEAGSLEIMKLLFDHSALMAKDTYGMTPLLAAAVTGNTKIVEYLISREDCCSEDRVEALKLLGATFVDKKRDLAGAVKFWRRALAEEVDRHKRAELAVAEAELKRKREELLEKKAELERRKAELIDKESQLMKKKAELVDKESQLRQTKEELSSKKAELTKNMAKLSAAQAEETDDENMAGCSTNRSRDMKSTLSAIGERLQRASLSGRGNSCDSSRAALSNKSHLFGTKLGAGSDVGLNRAKEFGAKMAAGTSGASNNRSRSSDGTSRENLYNDSTASWHSSSSNTRWHPIGRISSNQSPGLYYGQRYSMGCDYKELYDRRQSFDVTVGDSRTETSERGGARQHECRRTGKHIARDGSVGLYYYGVRRYGAAAEVDSYEGSSVDGDHDDDDDDDDDIIVGEQQLHDGGIVPSLASGLKGKTLSDHRHSATDLTSGSSNLVIDDKTTHAGINRLANRHSAADLTSGLDNASRVRNNRHSATDVTIGASDMVASKSSSAGFGRRPRGADFRQSDTDLHCAGAGLRRCRYTAIGQTDSKAEPSKTLDADWRNEKEFKRWDTNPQLNSGAVAKDLGTKCLGENLGARAKVYNVSEKRGGEASGKCFGESKPARKNKYKAWDHLGVHQQEVDKPERIHSAYRRARRLLSSTSQGGECDATNDGAEMVVKVLGNSVQNEISGTSSISAACDGAIDDIASDVLGLNIDDDDAGYSRLAHWNGARQNGSENRFAAAAVHIAGAISAKMSANTANSDNAAKVASAAVAAKTAAADSGTCSFLSSTCSSLRKTQSNSRNLENAFDVSSTITQFSGESKNDSPMRGAKSKATSRGEKLLKKAETSLNMVVPKSKEGSPVTTCNQESGKEGPKSSDNILKTELVSSEAGSKSTEAELKAEVEIRSAEMGSKSTEVEIKSTEVASKSAEAGSGPRLVKAYRHTAEAQTFRDLEDLSVDPDAMRMHALVVRERILGAAHPDTSYYIRYRGAVYADMGDFARCLELWTYALNMQQTHLEPLSPMTQSSFLSFAELFSFMMNADNKAIAAAANAPAAAVPAAVSPVHAAAAGSVFQAAGAAGGAIASPSHATSQQPPARKVKFEDMLSVFNKAVVELERALNHIGKTPSCERDVSNFNRYLLIIVHLVSLIARVTSIMTPDQLHRFKAAVYRVVRLNPRGARGQTPLHLACARETTNVGRFPVCAFPDPAVVSILLEVGARVDAVDHERNTPLHVAARCATAKGGCEAVTALLTAGAHIDACNAARRSPAGILGVSIGTSRDIEPASDSSGFSAGLVVAPLRYVTLKCLAAKKIVECGIDYGEGKVPEKLEAFIRMH